MTIPNLDLGLAYNVVRGTETVTLRVKTGDAATAYDSQSVPLAKRYEATRAEKERLGVGAVSFRMWEDNLNSKVPLPGHEIVDSGGAVYRVMEVSRIRLGRSYMATCQAPK